MKKFIIMMLAGVIGICNCKAQGNYKDSDTVLTALKNAVIPKFHQLQYTDNETGRTMDYNLFIPEDYDGSKSYPLLLFIADASTVNKGVTAPLEQGYGALLFASEADQKRHPCFVLVPQYTTVTVGDGYHTSWEVDMTIRILESLVKEYNVDENRLYTTGQSMGGMMSLHFNIAYPNLFAASLFVGCQWDTSKMAGFIGNKFFYIVSAGDPKAPVGMASLKEVLLANGGRIAEAEWSAKLPQDEQDSLAQALIDQGCNINMVTFTKGTTLPEGTVATTRAGEHMTSFDFAYKLTPVRDWLFRQTRSNRDTDILASLRDPAAAEVLVTAHAGDWHGTKSNSVHAVSKAVEKGAHIVSIDTSAVSNEYLRDILTYSKGKILVQFEQPASCLDQIKEMAAMTGTEDIIILASTEHDEDLMYIPLIDLDGKSPKKHLKAVLRNDPVAVELRFSEDSNPYLTWAVRKLKGRCRICFNTCQGKGFAGSHDDPSPGSNPEEAWGELIKIGGAIIVSDQIKPLLRYLN